MRPGIRLPHVEVDSAGLNFVVVERGKEHERRTTQDLDKLLYWIFEDITHETAGADAARQLELLGSLDESWCARYRAANGEPFQRAAATGNRQVTTSG